MRRRLVAWSVFVGLALAGCVAPPGEPGDPSCPAPCEFAVDTGPDREFEPHAAIRPGDPSHLIVASTVWTGSGDFGAPRWLKSFVSFDGGATFEGGRFPGDVAPTHPLATYVTWADPNVVLLEDGSAVYVGMGGKGAREDTGGPTFAFTAFDVFAARSTDGGRTWPEATVLAEGSGLVLAPATTLQDQPFVAAGRGAHAHTVIVAWAEVVTLGEDETHSVIARVSKDGGATWGETARVMEGGYVRNARPAVLADGTLVMAFRDRAASHDASPLLFARSSNDGATWTVEPIPDVVSSWSTPLVATPDALHMVVPSLTPDGPETITLLTTSDVGATWRARPLATMEREGLTTPAIAADERGALHVSWLEPQENGSHTLVVATLAPDEEPRFEVANRTRIGGNMPDGALGWPALGDYRGMAGADEGALVAWVSGEAPDTDLRATWIGRG